jgi:hypothetical protein
MRQKSRYTRHHPSVYRAVHVISGEKQTRVETYASTTGYWLSWIIYCVAETMPTVYDLLRVKALLPGPRSQPRREIIGYRKKNKSYSVTFNIAQVQWTKRDVL